MVFFIVTCQVELKTVVAPLLRSAATLIFSDICIELVRHYELFCYENLQTHCVGFAKELINNVYGYLFHCWYIISNLSVFESVIIF